MQPSYRDTRKIQMGLQKKDILVYDQKRPSFRDACQTHEKSTNSKYQSRSHNTTSNELL